MVFIHYVIFDSYSQEFYLLYTVIEWVYLNSSYFVINWHRMKL